jgi:hypothetical protein
MRLDINWSRLSTCFRGLEYLELLLHASYLPPWVDQPRTTIKSSSYPLFAGWYVETSPRQTKLKFFTAINIRVEVFCVVVPCSDVVQYHITTRIYNLCHADIKLNALWLNIDVRFLSAEIGQLTITVRVSVYCSGKPNRMNCISCWNHFGGGWVTEVILINEARYKMNCVSETCFHNTLSCTRWT